MRVLFVTHNIPRFSGDAAGSFIHRLAVGLQGLGVTVDVIAPASDEQAGDDVVDGVRIKRVPYARNMTLAYGGTMAEAVKGSMAQRLAFIGLFRALRRATIRFVADANTAGKPINVVHAHWWIPAGIAVWLARFGNRNLPPYLITMHGSDVRLAQGVSVVHPLMRRVLHGASTVTAVSTWLAQAATRIAPHASVQVGPMPVNEQLFVPDRSVARRDAILFVGRLNAQKGVADLLDAMTHRELQHAHCDIVGDGPDESRLVQQARALGIADRVTWHGRLTSSELIPLYQSSRVVAMPSREEGLGLVAVEAQLCETPVVAYASGGLPDVVRPDDGGVLVTAGDVAALAGALARAINQPDESAKLGSSARNAMLQRFSTASVAQQYKALYSRTANSGKQ